MAELDFAILEEATLPDFQPLPEGWYRAEVATAERKESAAGNYYLAVEFIVTDEVPANSRTHVWSNYNLWHPAENVVEIAQRTFSDLARACGLANCKDSDDLLGMHLDVKLKTKPGNGEFQPTNDVAACRTAPGMANQKAPIESTAVSLDDPPWKD